MRVSTIHYRPAKKTYQELLDGTSGILRELRASPDCAFASPQDDLAGPAPVITSGLWTVDGGWLVRTDRGDEQARKGAALTTTAI